MSRRLLWVAVLVGVSIRLWGAATFRANYDQESWRIVARLMDRGGDVYMDTDRYNYAPLWPGACSGCTVWRGRCTWSCGSSYGRS